MSRTPISSEGRQQWPLRSGRLLGYQVYGAAEGRPVYFFHGFPGSHEQAALVADQARQAGVALVAFDRPGFGDSSPRPGASFEAIAADVAELADALGHPRFAVLGVSCGGPHALATARALPDRVTAVGLLAGIGPMDRPEIRKAQLPPLKLLFGLARLHRWLAAPMLALDWLLFKLAPEKAVQALSSLLTAPDQALLARDAVTRQRFGHSLARAYAQGLGGAMSEAQRIARHRSSSLHGIRVPVHVYQSGRDRHVPPDMGAYQVALMQSAVLHACPDEGHLSIVVHYSGDCIARLNEGPAWPSG